MIRLIFVASCSLLVLLPSGCVRTSLEAGENHPANPNAATPPNPETPPTLRPGFDPNGEETGEKPDPHQHHHHHHHDPAHDHHDPGPTDGGPG